ncbi:MAG: hypothetical protein AB1847_19655 [bacterium]
MGKNDLYPEMKTYVSSKIVKAAPMDDRTFMEKARGKVLAGVSSQPGYIVEYRDKYVSWCPKEEFESTHREITEAEKILITSTEQTEQTAQDE